MVSDDLGGQLYALLLVIWIDLVLAGDNAIIIGLAAGGLPPEQKKKAIILGVAAAAVLRIIFAVIIKQLLDIPGIRLIGGLLLVWVCWKMYTDLLARHRGAQHHEGADIVPGKKKSLFQAMMQIVVADVSMSLDNVLAVAAATQGKPEWILIFGLALSVVMMGLGAALIANLLERYPIIGWIGLLVIVKVTAQLVGGGLLDVLHWRNVSFSPETLNFGIVVLPALELLAFALMMLLGLFGWWRSRRTPVSDPVAQSRAAPPPAA
jgi:YjbE family integral membrane protein